MKEDQENIYTTDAPEVIAPELPFPIQFIELTKAQEEISLNGYRIRAFRVNHNVTCYGYSIEIDRAGKFQLERALELNIPKNFWNRLQKGETVTDGGMVYTPDLVMGAPRKGIKVVYCTDTRPTPSVVENAKGADLFICEGMYGEKDKQAKAVENKHMTFYEAARMAKEADVGEMWLTHYSPSLTRPEEYMDEVRRIFPRAKAGKDRKSAELNFEDDDK